MSNSTDSRLETNAPCHSTTVNADRPDKPKVVFVQHSLPNTGGAERVVFELIRGLRKRNYAPVLACLYELGDLGERLKASGVRTHQNIVRGKLNPANAWRLRQVLRQENADVLYVTNAFHNVLLGRLGAMLAGTPLSVIAFHSYDTVYAQAEQHSSLKRGMSGLADRVSLPFYHRAIALADSHKRYLSSVKRIPSAKIEVVHNGIDYERFATDLSKSEARERFGLPNNRKIVGIIARLNRCKSHDQFLKVARLVHQQDARSLFVIAGTGPEQERLQEITLEYGLQESVVFLGHVSDVPPLLRAFDVTVLTSYHEALPLALLESMAASVPVVCSDVGSVDAMVTDDYNGYRLPFGDNERFADCVLRLLQDAEKAKRMGEAGRQLVESSFTLEKMAERTDRLLCQWTHRPSHSAQ